MKTLLLVVAGIVIVVFLVFAYALAVIGDIPESCFDDEDWGKE